MRRVQIFKMERLGTGTPQDPFWIEKTPVAVAAFHQFGVCYEEFEAGPGNYSVGIVELDDGTVELHPVHLLKFIDQAGAV